MSRRDDYRTLEAPQKPIVVSPADTPNGPSAAQVAAAAGASFRAIGALDGDTGAFYWAHDPGELAEYEDSGMIVLYERLPVGETNP